VAGKDGPVVRLLSLNVGLPRDIQWRGQTVHTAIWKESVTGRRMVRRLNIDGDGQGDLAGHGGEHRAVMVYQVESYRYWERHFGRNHFSFGQFGENFTVEGLADDDVCIGDRYRIGNALFEVTQPRVTCYRVGIRMEQPEMPSLLVSHRRPGFYFRVLEEGEISAGDEIFKVAQGPERVTVADIDGLLYLSKHPRDQLERALRIPALSPGWRTSLQALTQAPEDAKSGNAGLSALIAPPPAWKGFRPLKVARVDRESASVVSFSFEDAGGSPLPPALPGQFLVLKLRPQTSGPPILRNYSMSGKPGASAYRVSVKEEQNGAGSMFLHHRVAVGDTVEVSAPRGSFTLRPGTGPVVLVSAGIGATPVLAMLHALASVSNPPGSPREVWWFYGARNRADHPFAEESRELLRLVTGSRSFVAYSRPGTEDKLGVDYDVPGHLNAGVMKQVGVPFEADFYLCGPVSFTRELTAGLKDCGVSNGRIYSETFGPEQPIMPGIINAAKMPVHAPAGAIGPGPQVSFTRSGLAVRWDPRFQTLLELAEACDVPVRWSCRTGVCHTCESALIGGTVDYRLEPLDPPADGNVLICCAQPRSEIEIDL
jgi:MOSC domain-containing protein YiiM/ferredoxin-NADP reductase